MSDVNRKYQYIGYFISFIYSSTIYIAIININIIVDIVRRAYLNNARSNASDFSTIDKVTALCGAVDTSRRGQMSAPLLVFTLLQFTTTVLK